MKLEHAYKWAAFRQGIYARLAAIFTRKAAIFTRKAKACEAQASRANFAMLTRRIDARHN